MCGHFGRFFANVVIELRKIATFILFFNYIVMAKVNAEFALKATNLAFDG